MYSIEILRLLEAVETERNLRQACVEGEDVARRMIMLDEDFYCPVLRVVSLLHLND
jgi:hypothetical protein